SRDAVSIALNLNQAAATLTFRMAKKAARAGIQRSDEDKFRGKRHGSGGTRDGDFAVFQRLPHDLQSRALELREFIEKEHAVVRDTDLSRHGNDTATEQADIGNRVVRSSKGTHGNESVILVK